VTTLSLGTRSSHDIDGRTVRKGPLSDQKQARSAPQSRAEAITNPSDCFSYSGGVLSVIAMATFR
jgi:hypothetical protein